MSENPKLFYYEARGRAEIVRLTMAAGNIQFDDIRFTVEEWPTYKEKAPFKMAPYMEIDGEVYGQSLALAMYAARKAGLYGNTLVDQLKIDQVNLMVQDLINTASTVYFYNDGDQEKKTQLATKFKEQDCPRFYGHFEKLLRDSGTGYLVGSSLTLADIVVFEIVHSGSLSVAMKDVMASVEDFPLLKALCAKVESEPSIKAYIATRPDTPM